MTIRRGRRVRRGCVVLHHLPEGDRTRAVVVAGRGVGPAVDRHRRQRQLRHALAGMWDVLPPGSLVVRALPGVADYDALVADLHGAVRQL